MNADQIAAEAAKEIGYFVRSAGGTDEHEFGRIIKAAIEKAYQQGFEHGASKLLMDSEAEIKELKLRAAHASQAWNDQDDAAVHRAAQTSEQEYDPNLTVPSEIMESAYKVSHWATMNGFKRGWCIGPVCDRAAQASEPPKTQTLRDVERLFKAGYEAGLRETIRECYAAGERMDWDWFKAKFGQANKECEIYYDHRESR